MEIQAAVALLDVEGTLGSIAFVRDVLFPYARERMDDYVEAHRDEPAIQAILADAAREAGVDAANVAAILDALHRWSDADVKITPLKALQGRIWEEGFTSNGIRGHLYPDAVEAIERFAASGVTLVIYSSGSVAAQKLFFGHSVAGDLLPFFHSHFDTATGNKREADSYRRIASRLGVAPGEIVFFSDVEQELDAARTADLQTVQLARAEDGTTASRSHASIGSFDGVTIRMTAT